ncbi:AGAP004472-PA-like protein [Anopheles sinensis]|uniref:AGAP004472-PA-like protein n=1 Tax=Anopheles sinensis TaxID=74873 RepID=A0A084VJI8_ANOSI|nr:AGAP004472-PA-like protein [Anopheles sinensis]
MHVQLTTQHFLQTYAHPMFWQSAKTFKDMLVELDTKELASESESNKLYIKYLDESIAHAEKLKLARSKFHQADFHWRIKEKIVTSKAFLYPALIPYKTFRLTQEVCKNARFTKNEEHFSCDTDMHLRLSRCWSTLTSTMCCHSRRVKKEYYPQTGNVTFYSPAKSFTRMMKMFPMLIKLN